MREVSASSEKRILSCQKQARNLDKSTYSFKNHNLTFLLIRCMNKYLLYLLGFIFLSKQVPYTAYSIFWISISHLLSGKLEQNLLRDTLWISILLSEIALFPSNFIFVFNCSLNSKSWLLVAQYHCYLETLFWTGATSKIFSICYDC